MADPPFDPAADRYGRERPQDAVADAHRRWWGLVVAATLRTTRDLDQAEDAAQDAFTEAVRVWPVEGVPDRPEGWLISVARRRAIDTVRRRATLQRKLPLLVERGDEPAAGTADGAGLLDDRTGVTTDELLRLIFLCCHPALAVEAQVALTLRLVCGVSTADVAAAYLVPEATMAARITRAKRKIAVARIPLRVPEAHELPDRLAAVLDVAYLVITAGHAPSTGASATHHDLLGRGVDLARTLHALVPGDTEIAGLLALALLTAARAETRTDDRGRLVPLEDQDRSRWDRTRLDEAHELIMAGLRAPRPAGRRLLQAAITSAQVRPATADEVDWVEVVALYDALHRVWPSPVVALHRLVGVARVDGPDEALRRLDTLETDPRLGPYRYRHVLRGELATAAGRHAEAADAFRRALEQSWNIPERDRLRHRLAVIEETADPLR